MSNIFAPWVRPFGTLPVDVGSGPIPGGGEDTQHLRFTADGKIYCSTDVINHYGAALPFDQYGRLVTSTADVVRIEQDIPFTASGAVAMQEGLNPRWDQGLTFLPSGHIATGDTPPPPEAPTWSTIPPKVNFQYELEETYNVSPYVSPNGSPITGYAINPPVTGFSIDANGEITCAPGTAVNAYSITVEATNAVGTTPGSFIWDIILGNKPVWTPLSSQTSRTDQTAQYNVNPFVSSDSGPILSITLVAPPDGITILDGIITVVAGTAVASYDLTVRATNGVGASDTPLNWTVLEELLPPQWITIGGKTSVQDNLPETHDVSIYVTSNAGALTDWDLITPPDFFTIDQNGVVTCGENTALAGHTIVVSVKNDVGTESSSFVWEVTFQLLAPQWTTVPDFNRPEDQLPWTGDANAYVSSNSGPLTGWTMIESHAGISIDPVTGILTVAAGTALGDYLITLEVTNDTGTSPSNTFTFTVGLVYLVPQWSTIPGQSTGDDDLPATLDVSPYVTTNAGPLTGWDIVPPVTGFTIDAAGLITVAGGTALNNYSITVEVDNDEGTGASTEFSWLIFDTPLPPQWHTVPSQTTREDNLPTSLDMTNHVTSNAGALRNWDLVNPITGFSINTAGLVTVAADTDPGNYSVQVEVTNDEGTELSNIFNWEVELYFLVPQWTTIPPQSTEEQLLPVVLDVKPYVTSNHGSLRTWTLPGGPSGWTIDTNGIITVAASRPVGSYSITVDVINDSGANSSTPFDWDILEEPLPPQWSTIPNKQTREDILPQTYDVSSYVTTNSGALTGWDIVPPVTGFTIDGAGVITAADGTTVAIHSLTVRVSNDEGPEDSASFTWEIQEELLLPQWSTVPDKETREDVLPQPYDMSLYVTSNAGDLILWRLASAPAGFTISSSTGIITAADTLAVSVNTLRVGVTNSVGEELSNTFNWDILEELVVPQWTTIPPQSSPADSEDRSLDVKPYVTSNSGPLTNWTIFPAVTGFSIVDGVVSWAPGTSQEIHSITVYVDNDQGTSLGENFTWEITAPTVSTYFHEFNAVIDTGFWSFSRPGNQTAQDNNTDRRQVLGNAAAYPGCGWDGNNFTPHAGFKGILLEGVATNQFWWSTKFFPADEVNFKWNGGWGTKNPTSSGQEESMNQVYTGNQITTHTLDVKPV